MPTLRYVVADVFTDTPLTGNQLAVFTDARDLDTETMQTLAREMNLSETVFVLPPEDGGHARIRIFTPKSELPFAGHPVLGSAFVLAAPLQLSEIRLETGSGIVPVGLEREGARIIFGRMHQPVPPWEPFSEAEELQEILGVRSRLPVELYRLGPGHVYLELESEEQVAALRPDFGALERYDAGVNCFAGSGTQWKNRMFAPSSGVAEDPATGSAARTACDPPRPPRSHRVRRRDRDLAGRRARSPVEALRTRGRVGGEDRAGRGRRLRRRRRARRVQALDGPELDRLDLR